MAWSLPSLGFFEVHGAIRVTATFLEVGLPLTICALSIFYYGCDFLSPLALFPPLQTSAKAYPNCHSALPVYGTGVLRRGCSPPVGHSHHPLKKWRRTDREGDRGKTEQQLNNKTPPLPVGPLDHSNGFKHGFFLGVRRRPQSLQLVEKARGRSKD